MNKKLIILSLGLMSAIQLFGQAERQAIENIWKGKWDKAFYQLDRAISKDTLRVTTAYAWAIFFEAEGNPDRSLDSASRYVRSSIVLYGRTSEKQRERIRRFPLDSLTLVALRDRIDSAAFFVARAGGTVTAYQHFIDAYPGAKLEARAIDARDERAFQDAVELNTHEAFRGYLDRYPNSSRYTDARANYERLLYLAFTRRRDLDGYQHFLRDHPGTSYEREAERNVFEIQTADGSQQSLMAYINLRKHYQKRAADILFHLQDGKGIDHLPESAWSDSIRAASLSTVRYIVPYLRENKFGFMDQEGSNILDARSVALAEDYLCGNITDNFIQLDSSIVGLNGAVIYSGRTDEVEDIGAGMLMVKDGGCHHVVHKSAWLPTPDCVEQAKTIAGRFLAVRRNGRWQLMTLAGRMVMEQRWDDITDVNQLIVLEAGGKKYMSTPERLAAFVARPQGQAPYTLIRKIARWPGNNSWVQFDGGEALLNTRTDTIAHTRDGVLVSARFGAIVRRDTCSHTVNWNRGQSECFRAIQVSGERAIVLTSDGWRLFDPVKRAFLSTAFDSLWWTGSFAAGTRRDSTYLFFGGGKMQRIKGRILATSLQGPDSTSFLLVEPGVAKTKSLYGQDGRPLFSGPYEKIQPMGRGYFRVSRGSKMGLVATDGKLVVPMVMDAIGALNNQAMSLLRDGRFGLFHCTTRKVMQPQFPTNPVPYGEHYLVVRKDGLSGVFTWDNKPVSKYEYAEVRYWNDTAAFVRRDARWSLINLRNNAIIVDQIRDFRFIRERKDDQLAIVHAGDLFGVLHNRKGTVIPLTFTDITNVGSAEWPLYFTEKHVAEASMYVVIYFDRDGKFLRKEVYDSHDYERIYCPNN